MPDPTVTRGLQNAQWGQRAGTHTLGPGKYTHALILAQCSYKQQKINQ